MFDNKEIEVVEVQVEEEKAPKPKRVRKPKVEKSKFEHVVGLDDARHLIRGWFIESAAGKDFPFGDLEKLAKWCVKKGL